MNAEQPQAIPQMTFVQDSASDNMRSGDPCSGPCFCCATDGSPDGCCTGDSCCSDCCTGDSCCLDCCFACCGMLAGLCST
ncbi:hypothetical protein M407DRAFT_171154 [Tulasnella calospora MUT 4182]|uniref:Uncharacterized protein n=1 Tax=Tulasnella calospora MUT 4182 TaxID=1051891 RepID=A0A0C3PS45_9AGAM|nr:hypothetical protein M407DRAFT_171154 [Tulasnella calospora MUT 4182]